MFITRKNCESFFLLYADDELCAQDRKNVEEFVKANTDLQREFDMLQATVLPAEEIIFSSKDALFRKALPDRALQEKLLLLIDNELSQKESAALQSLLEKDADVKEEYEILLQTKLSTAEQLVFPAKQSLYRKEKDNVLIGRFVRWAAAAVLLGFGLYWSIVLFNKNNNADVVQNTVRPIPQKNTNTVPAVNTTAPDAPKNIAVFKAPVKTVSGKKDKASSEKDFVAVQKEYIHNDLPQNNNLTGSAKIKPGNAVAKVLVRKNEPAAAPVKQATDNIAQSIAAVKPPVTKSVPVKEDNTMPADIAYAKAESFVNSGTASDNKILYMDEDEVKRSKPFGILRKVKKFVERTANIKPGNTLRVAGFEFKGG